MATLYDTLGVAADASSDEIKRAYRKAAMKWHPDRNVGREDAARAAFQEMRDAYSILSDADKRKTYDAVYAEEMRKWDRRAQQEQKRREERERAAQAAEQARYAKMVSIAMRFADEGYNRDVLFGVLLGHRCEADLANQIADSVWALCESRRAPEPAPEPAAASAEAAESVTHDTGANPSADAKDATSQHDRRPAGMFDSLWHGLFGIRT